MKLMKLKYLFLILAIGLVGFKWEAREHPERLRTEKERRAVSQYPKYRPNLQDLINTKWASYGADKANWGGGIAMRILSPKGEFFVSANMGDNVNEHIHFRGASTTKTFTAASILLLQQNNLLNIDDKITDLIPGSGEPYVPDNSTYDIPYKDKITIRQLLSHRAGVFDVAGVSRRQ